MCPTGGVNQAQTEEEDEDLEDEGEGLDEYDLDDPFIDDGDAPARRAVAGAEG